MDINVPALNTWLINKIKPVCEANPKPLSEYITALVRKEKPIEELIAICNDQLKVFLQENTTDFVNELFDVIADKSYLSTENIGRNQSPKQIKEEESSISPDKKEVKNSSSSRSSRYSRGHHHHDSRHRRHRSRSLSHSSSSSSDDYRNKSHRSSHRNSNRSKLNEKNRLSTHNTAQGGFTYPTGYFNNDSNNVSNNSVWQDGVTNQHSIQTLDYNSHSNWNSHKRNNHFNRSPPKNIISVPIVGLNDNDKKNDRKPYQSRNPSYDPENPSINSLDNVRESDRLEESKQMQQPTYEPSPIKSNNTTNLKSQKDDPVGILVTRIPWHSNNLENLSNHFSQFGKIVNIECNFQQSNSKALVQFSNKYEVQAAFRSPEPILSNRFIRIFLWGPNGIINDSTNQQQTHGLQTQKGAKRKYQQPTPKPTAPPSVIPGPCQTKWVRKSNESVAVASGDYSENDSSMIKNPDNSTSKKSRRFRLERSKNEASCSESDYSNDEFEKKNDSNGRNSITQDDSGWISQLNKQQNMTHQRTHRISESEPAKLKTPSADPMELFKEAKMKYEALQKKQVQRLTMQLKNILEQLDSIKDTTDSQDSDNKENLKKELFEEAKSLHKEIQEIKEKGIIPRKSDPKGDKHNKPQLSTLNNAAGKKLVRVVNSFMDGQSANKRIERIEQINKEISEICKQRDELKEKLDTSKSELQPDVSDEMIDLKEQDQNKTTLQEMNRKILTLKRELISLETITMSDLAVASQKNSHKAATKLDKRPRTLFIKNLTASQVEEYIYLTKVKYLHIEDHKVHQIDENDPESIILEVTYRTRDFAESAQAVMSNYLRKPLLMSFTPPENLKPTIPTS